MDDMDGGVPWGSDQTPPEITRHKKCGRLIDSNARLVLLKALLFKLGLQLGIGL